MSDEIIISKFEFIIESIDYIQEWFTAIKTADDFLSSPTGRSHFDATLMRLQSIGESLKKIDKENPELLEKHQAINWYEIIRLREIISHHYDQLSHEIIFGICKNNLLPLKNAAEEIISELKKK